MGFFQTITHNVGYPIDHHADYFQSASNTNTSGRYVSLRFPVPAGNLLFLYTGSRKYLSSFCVVSALSFCPSGTGNERWLSFVDRPPSFPFLRQTTTTTLWEQILTCPSSRNHEEVCWVKSIRPVHPSEYLGVNEKNWSHHRHQFGIPGPFIQRYIAHSQSFKRMEQTKRNRHLTPGCSNSQRSAAWCVFILPFLPGLLPGRTAMVYSSPSSVSPPFWNRPLSRKRRNEERSFYLLLAPPGDTQHGVFSRKSVLSTFLGIFFNLFYFLWTKK